MKDLKGRTALITGASAGIGVHVARNLAKEGMNLVLAARREAELEKVASEIRSLGVRVLTVPTDVTNDEQLKHLVDHSVREMSGIDVLVNNAGIEAFRCFDEISIDDIRQTINVNLMASLILTRLVLPHMKQARRGHIVNMASVAGKQGPGFAVVYGASKTGLIAMTQSLRCELYGTGVSASAICPGFAIDGGIYEVIRDRSGRNAPWWVGGTTSKAVGRAVVRAIRYDKPEIILNIPALRPLFSLCSTFPRLGELIFRVASRRYLKHVAESHAK